jgi:hypothetical protein
MPAPRRLTSEPTPERFPSFPGVARCLVRQMCAGERARHRLTR